MTNLLRFLLLGAALGLAPDAFGCTIPVFRYALEKWELTPYDVIVYHRGPLPADLQKAIKQWDVTPAKANIDITIVDLDDKVAPDLDKLWKREGQDKQTPWMLVRSQASGSKEPSAWSGSCTVAALNNLFESPARQTVVGHLSRGASVVYVLLKSGDAKADEAAYDLASKELQALEKMIKLPVQSEDGPKMRLPLPLKVVLPIITLDRDRPEEAAFVKLLLATEEDLDKKKGPILFPIFGRGRVLCSLAEKELTKELILQATQFLCKECSCQVKEQNPGADMLLAANWNEIFDKMFEEPITPESPPVKEAPSASSESSIAPAPVLTAATPPPATCDVCRMWLWAGTAVAAGMVLASGAWLVMQMRKA